MHNSELMLCLKNMLFPGVIHKPAEMSVSKQSFEQQL